MSRFCVLGYGLDCGLLVKQITSPVHCFFCCQNDFACLDLLEHDTRYDGQAVCCISLSNTYGPSMSNIFCTQKLLKRIKQPIALPVEQARPARLGDWYATAIFWKPQVALFMSTTTLLPVFVPLAPAATVHTRLAQSLKPLLEEINTPAQVIEEELAALSHITLCKTQSRSLLGSQNELVFHADVRMANHPQFTLTYLSRWLGEVPMKAIGFSSPLEKCKALLGSDYESFYPFSLKKVTSL